VPHVGIGWTAVGVECFAYEDSQQLSIVAVAERKCVIDSDIGELDRKNAAITAQLNSVDPLEEGKLAHRARNRGNPRCCL
jgi:hypothetical protein